jgi:hypothetical protein
MTIRRWYQQTAANSHRCLTRSCQRLAARDCRTSFGNSSPGGHRAMHSVRRRVQPKRAMALPIAVFDEPNRRAHGSGLESCVRSCSLRRTNPPVRRVMMPTPGGNDGSIMHLRRAILRRMLQRTCAPLSDQQHRPSIAMLRNAEIHSLSKKAKPNR